MNDTHDTHKRILAKSLLCGFLISLLFSLFPFAASCEELPQTIMRLHVVANSDDPQDQALKLKVRDAVLQEASRWYGDARSLEEANREICNHLESILNAAKEALRENGSQQSVTVQVKNMYFSTRDYQGFTLPAGAYRALRVTLGKGEGKNWWCIVFPALCLPAAQEEDPLALLPEKERELVKENGTPKIKFKAVEWYEQIRDWLKSGA